MKVFKSSLISMVTAVALVASAATLAKGPKKPTEGTSIVDAAVAVNAESGEFSTLLFAATLYPDIVAYLSAKGQRTLFAPTDEAFEKLNAILPMFCYADVVDLATQQPEYVGDVLTYHVTTGRLEAAEVLPKSQIRMLTGDFITRTPGSLQITDELGRNANLEMVDVKADNGIIHVISEVILPYPPASACE